MQERRKASGSTTIKVIGVGGAGCNAVNRMIETGLEGVEFVSMNTDDQVLERTQCEHRVQLGEELTKGRGAGGNPQIGMEAAKESIQEIGRSVDSAAMVFITAGMGGGTGTGAAPVVAEASKQAGALTVAVVTRPFTFEGPKKQRIAEQGIAELSKQVDAVIVIPNDRLTEVADRHVTFMDAFRMADDVLRQGVQGISDIIQIAGIINVDFADVKSIMENAGTALMGIGIGTGDDRAAIFRRVADNRLDLLRRCGFPDECGDFPGHIRKRRQSFGSGDDVLQQKFEVKSPDFAFIEIPYHFILLSFPHTGRGKARTTPCRGARLRGWVCFKTRWSRKRRERGGQALSVCDGNGILPLSNWIRPAALRPYPRHRGLRPVALRPSLSAGLPFSNDTVLLIHRLPSQKT